MFSWHVTAQQLKTDTIMKGRPEWEVMTGSDCDIVTDWKRPLEQFTTLV